MTLGDIVKRYREENKLSMEEFAKKSSLSKGYISMLERNKNPKTGNAIVPSLETIKLVSSAINEDFNNVISELDGEQKIFIGTAQLPSNTLPLPRTYKVPLLGTIACGTPIFAEENTDEYINTPENICADFCLRCKGDSMINARIFDGDIVYLQKQSTVDNGEIAAVLIDDLLCEATLKRVYRNKEQLRLCAENPTCKDIVFFHEEMNSVRIIGKAIAFLSTVK